jgi:hypothetical protein
VFDPFACVILVHRTIEAVRTAAFASKPAPTGVCVSSTITITMPPIVGARYLFTFRHTADHL